MQPEPNLPHALGYDQDISRLKNLFASSFPVQDKDFLEVSEELAPESPQQGEAEEENFDWSITLDNIREITERAKASEARVQAAEARAEKAETKSKEALHWLKVLRKAVLDGIPQGT